MSAPSDSDPTAALNTAPFPGGLTRAEIGDCRDYWQRAVQPQGGLSFDALDGLLTAISVLPQVIPPERWAPIALGGDLADGDSTEREVALTWLYRFGAHVGRRVRLDPDVHRDESLPEFDFSPAEGESEEAAEARSAAAWSAGAAQGLALAPEAVAALSTDADLRDALAPFILLGRAGMDETTPFTRRERRQLMRAAAYGAYRLWLHAAPQRLQAARRPVRAAPEPGRNDPCPCGSGQKYKKCHGATRH